MLCVMMIDANAEALNISLPKKAYQIPAGDLSDTLPNYAAESGILLGFDPILTQGKRSHALKGQYGVQEGFDTLLKDSGLEVTQDKSGRYQLRHAPPKPKPIPGINDKPQVKEDKTIQLDQIQVRAKRFYEIGPLPGLGLTKDQIPGNVQSITAKEIKESHSLSITDLMNKKLQSVTVNDYQGNPFQMDVQYRGFTAGPQIGMPQGLSVFFDGIRVNEPFGDVVNWDMIPMNALSSVDVFPGSNPIFGLNTLGGAFTVKTKDGFNNEGIDAEVLTGSYGRKQLQATGGWNNGTVALFGAGNFFLEDGWRENSPSKVNQFFGKASYRGDKLDLNLSTLLVKTELVGNGLLPSEMYSQDPRSVFSSPDTTDNRLAQFQLSGAFHASDNFSVTGQVYRRKSDRHQVGADVFTDIREDAVRQIMQKSGAETTCLFAESEVTKGVPFYYVIPVPADANGYADISATQFYTDIVNNYFDPAYPDGRFFVNPADYQANANIPLPEEMAARMRDLIAFDKNYYETIIYNRGASKSNAPVPLLRDSSGNPVLDGSGNPVASFGFGVGIFSSAQFTEPLGSNISSLSLGDDNYFFTPDPGNPGGFIKNFVVLAAPANNDACVAGRLALEQYRADGLEIPIDGAVSGYDAVTGQGQPGVVKGVPTAIFNDNQIKQIVDGASIQFNWNLDHHKFMVGASIDAASAEYNNSSQLGFLTANRTAYLDPAQAHPMFIGAFVPLNNNDFNGTNTTKSIYFSETWSPVATWNFSASGRYNQTKTINKIAVRYGNDNYGIGDLISYPDRFNVCEGDCTVNRPPTGNKPFLGFKTVDASETEKFSFYSFNPQLGATWQARENLNLFANWSRGTRTPSVIELGCAFDKTLVPGVGNTMVPRSIAENRQCTLPTTLSGDPFLPQIKATTYDLGMRGTFKSLWGTEDLQWNVGAYQTDLKDDIYFVTYGNGTGFFDSIGKTRRRGIETGLSGKKDKWGFSLNYSLTDATFENDFNMISEDNTSATFVKGFGKVIQVKKGSSMPGVALHNLNASVSYDVNEKWTVGLSAVAHSKSFVRGNENNEHKAGFRAVLDTYPDGSQLLGRPNLNPGTVPGYAVFNLQTSYKLNGEWTATMQVNNLFDREYFTAGRLGQNPFSPSIYGAIGPDGFNHNSDEWLSTNFISPSAPRGVWFSLNWQFDPNTKPSF
ncbi:TonB-dependent receptor domain-containing protein [Methylotenera sp. 1P/1]|uniref:TonB-dependent receptor domain-containing protein n=1 Tax=Methylotenera sp. 1P/1 TaxID=1131551 RepID=UPI00037DED8E